MSKQVDRREGEGSPFCEFNFYEPDKGWIPAIAGLYKAATKDIEFRPEAGFVRCRWCPKADGRWFDLTVSKSETPDNSFFHVTLNIVKQLDTTSIFHVAIGSLRLFPQEADPYVQYIGERPGNEPGSHFLMELHRSGLFTVTGQ